MIHVHQQGFPHWHVSHFHLMMTSNISHQEKEIKGIEWGCDWIYDQLNKRLLVCVCVWNFWTEVKPQLLLLFQLSDSEGGRGMQTGTTSNEATWLDGIQSLISSAYLLHFPIWVASGQANFRPAIFSCLHKWRNLRLWWKTATDLFF